MDVKLADEPVSARPLVGRSVGWGKIHFHDALIGAIVYFNAYQ